MAKHSIEQFIIRLKSTDEQQAQRLKDKLLQLLKGKLGRMLEALLDEYDKEGGVRQLPQLRIDLGRLNSINWERELLRQLLKQLAASLAQALGAKGAPQTDWLALRQFLETGRFPAWWQGSRAVFDKPLPPKSSQQLWTYLQGLKAGQPAFKRWIWQWSDTQRWKLLEAQLNPKQRQAIAQTWEQIPISEASVQLFFWQAALRFTAQNRLLDWKRFWERETKQEAVAGLPTVLSVKASAEWVTTAYQGRYTNRDVLLYYLEQGALPSWAGLVSKTELLDYLQEAWTTNTAFWSDWLQRQARGSKGLWQLMRLLPEGPLWAFLEQVHSKAAFRFAKSLLNSLEALFPQLQLSPSNKEMQRLLRAELLHYAAEQKGRRFFKKQLFERLLEQLLLHDQQQSDALLENLQTHWNTLKAKGFQKKWLDWLESYKDPAQREQKLSPISAAGIENLKKPSQGGLLDYLRFILQQGTRPWWAESWPQKDLSALLTDLLAQNPAALLKALRTWMDDALLEERIVEQFPAEALQQLLLLQLPEKGGAWLRFGELMLQLPRVLPALKAWSPRRLQWGFLLKQALHSSEQQSLQAQLEAVVLALAAASQLHPLRILEGLEQLLTSAQQPVLLVFQQLLSRLKQQPELQEWSAESNAKEKTILAQLKAWGYSSERLRKLLVDGADQAALLRYLQEGLKQAGERALYLKKLRQRLQAEAKQSLEEQSNSMEQELLQADLLAIEKAEDFELRFLEEQQNRPRALQQFLRQNVKDSALIERLAEGEELLQPLSELWSLARPAEWKALLSDVAHWGDEVAARRIFVQLLIAEEGDLAVLDWLRESLLAQARAQSRELLPLILDWRSAWRQSPSYSLLPFYLLELQAEELKRMVEEQENPRMRDILRERLKSSQEERLQLAQQQAELRALWEQQEKTEQVEGDLAERLAEIGRLEREKAEADSLERLGEIEQLKQAQAAKAAERAKIALRLEALYASLSPSLRLALVKEKRLKEQAERLGLEDLSAIEISFPLFPPLPAAQADNWTRAAFVQERLKHFFKVLGAWEKLLESHLSAYLQRDAALLPLEAQLPEMQRSLEKLARFLEAAPERFEQYELQLRLDLPTWQAQLEVILSQLNLLEGFESRLQLSALRQIGLSVQKALEGLAEQRSQEPDLSEADAFGLAQLEKWLTEQERLREQLEQIRDWASLLRWERQREAVERRQRAADRLNSDIEARWEVLDELLKARKAALRAALEERLQKQKAALLERAKKWEARSTEWLKKGLRRDKRKEKSELREALEKRAKKESDLTGVALLVKNAGLVLLWPFFSRFFKMLKLLEGKQFVDEKAQLKAIHLLQYLATAQTETPEYELSLNKVLCGWPLDQPVPRSVDLSEEELEIADSLLQGVLQNWSKMKSTTPDGLRGGFIVREGQLLETEERWQLAVEAGNFDILLKTLPWGYNLIALPWMGKMLAVDW